LVNMANTCSLSFDLVFSGPDGALSGSGYSPSWLSLKTRQRVS
jgi:hypothetical protein